MFNCNSDLKNFEKTKVTLSEVEQNEMRKRRDANRDRLAKNLEESIKKHQSQGSYSMHTMVQKEGKDYDIDDGVVFLITDLKGVNGTDKSSLNARKMVRDAIDDGSFSEPPRYLKNCVRIYYKEGYHVDIPVYREKEDGTLELASSYWKESDPSAVTEWYNSMAITLSPDSTSTKQFRVITRLFKAFCSSRHSWDEKMPSGFALSVLLSECYCSDVNRLDASYANTVDKLIIRLQKNLEVNHPILVEKLIDQSKVSQTTFLLSELQKAKQNLDSLKSSQCDKEDAYKIWYKVFNHDFWKELANKFSKSSGSSSASIIPSTPAAKPHLF